MQLWDNRVWDLNVGLISSINTSAEAGNCAINSFVKHPVPGPNSTTYFMVFMSNPSNIFSQAAGVLGTMLAFCLGFRKNSVKKVMVTKPEGVERSMCV